jgi:DNA-binding CsgD family transcriptional regulator/predicted ATPase
MASAEPTGALLGREKELEVVVQWLLAAPGTVVTIAGLPGVGKSALAAEASRRLPQPSVWVDVANARSAADVYALIAGALGGDVPPNAHAVCSRLRSSETVLVLDGCDCAPPVTAAIATFAERCPGVRLLATARSSLDIDREHTIQLSPLPLLPRTVDDPELLAGAPTVRLFLRRARRADPSFAPAPEDLRAIAELCRNLDGIPLAIELAAARLTLMEARPLVDVASRLGAWKMVGIDLEAELHRAIDHLAEVPTRVLLALATFAGDTTVEAAHAVVGGDGPSETMDALTALVDLHLVRADTARARFSIMSSAKPLLADRLSAQPLGRELRERHARYFAARARARRVAIGSGTSPNEHVVEFAEELRALEWLRIHGTHDEALRLAVDVSPDFVARGDPAGGRALLVESLALAAGACDVRTRIEAHLAIVRLDWEGTGSLDVEGASARLWAARQLAEESGDRKLLRLVLNAECEHHTLLGSFDEAARAVQAALNWCGGPEDTHARVNLLGWAAVVAHQRGRPDEAHAIIWEAIQLALPLGERRLTDRTFAIYWGLPEHVRHHDGDVPSLAELIELARLEGDRRGEGWLVTIAIGNALDRGDIVAAADACRSAIDLSRRTGNVPLCRQVLAATMRLAAGASEWETAALLEGALSRDAITVTARVPPHTVAALREATRRARRELGAPHHRKLLACGRRLELPDAVDRCETLLDELTAAAPTPLVGWAAGSSHRADFTPREEDLLALLAAGGTNKAIAAALHVSPATVRNQLHALFAKLGVRRRSEAAALAVRFGLGEDGVNRPRPPEGGA